MVQGNDNDYYLTHTFDKQSSANGCLFEDSRINSGLSSNHVIIYGHNMRMVRCLASLKVMRIHRSIMVLATMYSIYTLVMSLNNINL